MESKSINLCRGKRKSDGKWVEGNYLHLNVGRDFICDGTVWIGTLTPCKEEVKPETVGRYTGLSDKNGKKIFEGDVCRNTRTGEIVSVKWHGTMAGFVWSKRKESTHLYDFGELFRAYDKFEIIGNIHDNPELLEGQA